MSKLYIKNVPILTHPTYNDIHIGCHQIVENILVDRIPINAVVGLVRGGLVPSTIISHILNLPLITLAYSSKNGKGDGKHENVLPKLPLEEYGNILIVDDICDSGETLEDVANYYMGSYGCLTASLYWKLGSKHCIDYSWQTIPEDAPYICMPWEVL